MKRSLTASGADVEPPLKKSADGSSAEANASETEAEPTFTPTEIEGEGEGEQVSQRHHAAPHSAQPEAPASFPELAPAYRHVEFGNKSWEFAGYGPPPPGTKLMVLPVPMLLANLGVVWVGEPRFANQRGPLRYWELITRPEPRPPPPPLPQQQQHQQ